MGIGVSLAFIALGAILAFALRVDLRGLDIHLVGWILILVGVISMIFTFAYTRPRRRAQQMPGADPAYDVEPGRQHVEKVVVERPEGPKVVERIVERPVSSESPGDRPAQAPSFAQNPAEAQDPALAQDPAVAQDPASENTPTPIRRPPRKR
ncbi:DUF6458 family protein [Spirillospora sp. NPDC052269]